jgi:hypothetical protein
MSVRDISTAMVRYVPQPLVVTDTSGIPWTDWERCAIGRRRRLTIAWHDLPDGTIDASTARKWAKAGRIELRHVEQADGSVVMEARPLRLGNGHAAATEAPTGRRQSRHAAVLAAADEAP